MESTGPNKCWYITKLDNIKSIDISDCVVLENLLVGSLQDTQMLHRIKLLYAFFNLKMLNNYVIHRLITYVAHAMYYMKLAAIGGCDEGRVSVASTDSGFVPSIFTKKIF